MSITVCNAITPYIFYKPNMVRKFLNNGDLMHVCVQQNSISMSLTFFLESNNQNRQKFLVTWDIETLEVESDLTSIQQAVHKVASIAEASNLGQEESYSSDEDSVYELPDPIGGLVGLILREGGRSRGLIILLLHDAKGCPSQN